MKAAVLTTLNAPLEIWDLEHAQHTHDSVCANGQVLVDVIASGICGAQLKEIAGEKNNAQFVPHLLGHEGVGIVRKVGAGVNVQLIGRKCVMHWRPGAGPEAFLPARYEAAGRTIGGGHVTTLCESAVVSANRITPVPDDVPDELCALLGCGLSTALGTIEQEAKLRFGESILIVGCGGVGLNLIQAARLACAYPIVAMDITDEKAEVVRDLGGHLYVNARDHGATIDLVAHFPETQRGFDVIIDTSGSVEAIERTMQMLKDGGRYVLVGQPKPGEHFKVMNAVNLWHGDHGKHIMSTQGGGFRPSMDIPRFINLWRARHLDFDSIVSHRIGLSEINDGIQLVRNGQAGRIMVMMR
jgi:S-(hydroxymethyl)glutathione dehydrogenase / alcohol dehydrogenase